jgi:CotH kinase protein
MAKRLEWLIKRIVLVLLLLTGGVASAQTITDFFDDTVLQEIHLDVNPEDWASIKANPRSDQYYEANFRWRGLEVDSIGIRQRGNATRNGTKPGLRVDFNRYESGRTFLGMKSVGLDNNAQDASMVKERVIMEVYTKLGLPAPRETSAKVYVNDEYYGVYTVIEATDKNFLMRNFNEDGGYLYEVQGTSSYRFEYLGAAGSLYDPRYFDAKTHSSDPDPGAPLVPFIQSINAGTDANFASTMSSVMNLNLFMKHLAVEDFMGETDGILNGLNNFCMYRFENKMWQFIGKDKDLTFGGDPINANRPQTPLLQHANDNILIRRAMTVAAARDSYFTTITSIAQFAGVGSWMESEIVRMSNQIRAAVLADSVKQCQVSGSIGSCTNDRFESEVAADLDFVHQRGDSALAQVAALSGQRLFSVTELGAVSITRASNAAAISVGYGTIDPNTGSTNPAAVEIFTLRQNGVVVTETSVPASTAIQHGLIYADVSGSAKTGIAIANPGTTQASISFSYTDGDGKTFGEGTLTVPAKEQIARFLNEAPFNLSSPATATLSFDSSSPVYVVALRGLINERSEVILSTLPVSDSTIGQGTTVIPYFIDGGGWSTQIILMNSSAETMQGTIQLVDRTTQATTSSFTYSIAARSYYRLQTPGTSSSIQAGQVRIVPASNGNAPVAFAIFSLRKDDVTVSEASVSALAGSTAYRLYVENSDAIQTGITIANPSASPATVMLDATTLSGASAGLTGTLTIPGNGQVAQFLAEIPGFENIGQFQGVLRISAASNIVAAGLRGRVNERGDFLIATLPSTDENAAAVRRQLAFPHYVEGAGYTAQFILFSGSKNSSPNGVIKLFDQSGNQITAW